MNVQNRRIETERKIVEALQRLLASSGFREVGVNAVAREAKVSKELIYRYYGGVDGILERLMKEQDFWPSLRNLNQRSAHVDPGKRIPDMVVNESRKLRGNAVLKEIRSWELIDKTELTAKLAEEREKASLEFLGRNDIAPDDDRVPLVALMLAGVLYLGLRSNTADSFMGIPLNSEEGWARLEAVLDRVLGDAFSGDDAADRPGPPGSGTEDG